MFIFPPIHWLKNSDYSSLKIVQNFDKMLPEVNFVRQFETLNAL